MFLKKYIPLMLLLASSSSLYAFPMVTVDFITDDDGNTLLEGDGSVDSGLEFGNGMGQVQPYGSIFDDVGLSGGLNFSSPTNLVTLFDSDGTGGLDDDLERGGDGVFDGGNAFDDTFGNLLILQTSAGNSGAAQNNVDLPNDNGPGGTLVINSDLALSSFSFSYIDLDQPANSTITFFDSDTGNSEVVRFAELEDATVTNTAETSSFNTIGVDFGDNHANTIDPITASALGLAQFDQITIVTEGSGGLGELTVSIAPIPEPSSTMLLALGAMSLTMRRKR